MEKEKVVIGVRFKKTGKLSFFDPLKFSFRLGDCIVARTDRGEEIGRVVKIIRQEDLPKDVELKAIIKPATKKDMEKQKQVEEEAKNSLDFARREAKRQNLNMKILSAEYTFDMSKLTIYFVSEARVDFRELVKVLASEFKVRIELRQIGPRDEVKEFPCLGICGKEVCCRTYLEDFDPVTIKMAKDQGMQINMSKLSGACGKLMCCLRYEDEAYKELIEKMPKVGMIVETKESKEKGRVTNIDVLNMKVKIKFGENKEDEYFETYLAKDLKWDKNQFEKGGEG